LTLTLPKGLELTEGAAVRAVPALADGKKDGTTSVTWKVRVVGTGTLPVRVGSTTGMARTLTITLNVQQSETPGRSSAASSKRIATGVRVGGVEQATTTSVPDTTLQRLTCKWLAVSTSLVFVAVGVAAFLVPEDFYEAAIHSELWHAAATAGLLFWGARGSPLGRTLGGLGVAAGMLYLGPLLLLAAYSPFRPPEPTPTNCASPSPTAGSSSPITWRP